MSPIITLTTDFGTRDSYVGVMKGVMLGICPEARLVDITHAISPQHVLEAAFVIRTVLPYFPPGTIHLVVVDPGVGSARRPVVLATPTACLVGPDNGVFSLAWEDAMAHWPIDMLRAVELTETRFWRPQVSATFHGRDIFAPVAAHLAAGQPIHALGPPIYELEVLPVPSPRPDANGNLAGQIVSVDHFGNCISNITVTHLDQFGLLTDLDVVVGTHTLAGIHRTYADVAPGTALALVGSSEQLEVALRNGNAGQVLGIQAGDAVHVRRSRSSG